MEYTTQHIVPPSTERNSHPAYFVTPFINCSYFSFSRNFGMECEEEYVYESNAPWGENVSRSFIHCGHLVLGT